MKLMQLGLQVYVAEDATTAAIEKGDLLIAISRLDKSTRTYNIVSAAKSSGAGVVLLTQLPPFFKSRIRDISDLVFVLDDERDFAVGSFVDNLVTLITEKRRKN
jgi:D-arabinose 5-phosphate isomerase GutQ